MPELVLILFKINLVLLLFAAAYYLVLRRLTFYTLNRAFLVGGIIFSTVYPFINLTDFFHRQEQLNPSMIALVPTIDMNQLVKNNAIMDYWQIVVVLFYVGVVFMAIRLIAQFISLYRVHRNSTPGSVRNLNVRILKGPLSPFSFWQTVYINPAIHSTNELDNILAHEQVHVKEWHTLDIILAEISVVFYWFNPGVWLMKRAIKENIEFITDAKIVKRGIDKKAYQYSLLGVGNLQASVALVNNFNLSDLKKRIKMMNAKRSSPKKLVIYVLILPVLLVTTLAFTVSKKEVKKHLLPLTAALNSVQILDKPIDKIVIVSPKVNKKSNYSTEQLETVKKDTVQLIRYAVGRLMLSNDSLTTISDLSDDILAKIAELKGGLEGKVKGVKVTGTTFTYNHTDTLVMDKAGKIENVNVVVRRQGYPMPNSNTTIVVKGYKRPLPDSLKATQVNYFLDGKPISKDQLSQVDANDLKSVTLKKVEKDLAHFVIISKKD